MKLKFPIVTAIAPFGAAQAIALSVSMSPAQALKIEEIPNPRHQSTWTSDVAKILSPEQEKAINSRLDRLSALNGSEVAVVTVPETAPALSPKEFATDLFNYWGIGKKGIDNGVLILVSVRDRRVEIETGYGVEEILPDSKVGNIIKSKMLPEFRKGNYGKGVLEGTQTIANELDSYRFNSNPTVKAEDNNIWKILGIAGAVGIGCVVIFRPRYPRKYISPEAESRLEFWKGEYCCSECKRKMERVDATPYLSSPQLVAQKLGSTIFEGWKCPKCSGNGLHLMSDQAYSTKYVKCPRCKELTALRQESAIEKNSKLIEEICQCDFCNYHLQKYEEIPVEKSPRSAYGKPMGKRSNPTKTNTQSENDTSTYMAIAPHSPASSSDSSSSSSDSSSSWSSSSSDSSSSWSSSDFGGGSSGGGGAGDSW